MCGIFGSNSVGRLTDFELKFFANLGVLNTFRGKDSTGIFDYIPFSEEEIKKKAQPTLYWKDTVPSWEYTPDLVEQNLSKNGRWLKDRPELVVGHARSATKGAVLKKNAHPFSFKSLIGVHNGTINGPFNNSTKFETDSEALYYNIAEVGLEEALKEATKSAYSVAYALAYLDINAEILHLIRNKERPLAILNTGTCGHFSSDPRDLHYISPNSGFATSATVDWTKALDEGKVSIPSGIIVNLPEDILLTCETGTGLKEFTVKKVEPPKKVYTYTGTEHGPHFGRYRGGEGTPPFTPGTAQNTANSNSGTVSANPPVNSNFFYMRFPVFERVSQPKADNLNCCYAIELDGWVSPYYMKGLIFWRLMNKKEFAEKLRKTKSEYNNSYFAGRLEDAAMTRGDMKRINKGDFSWVEECRYKMFSQACVTRIQEVALKDWYKAKGLEFFNKFYSVNRTDNIIPLIRKDTDIVMYGNGLGVQFTRPRAEYNEARACGCKLCTHTPLPLDHLFWLNKDEFLCENDQILIAETYKKEGKNLLQSQVLIEELVKFTETWQKEERKMYKIN